MTTTSARPAAPSVPAAVRLRPRDLASLAKDCEADKCYEFLFVAPALPVTGAVGSPVNPLAIK